MNDKLYGDDAIVARVLEKVELAARRINTPTGGGLRNEGTDCLQRFANELQRIVKDMYAKPSS